MNIYAIYGTFTNDALPLVTIDVTDKLTGYINGNQLTLPQEINFDDAFGYIELGKQKYLQVSADGQLFNIAADSYVTDVVIDLTDAGKRIVIVYYLYTSPGSNWRAIVTGQLYQLKSYGILSEANLYIHITDCHGFADEVKTLINEITPDAIVSTSFKNEFEYPALKLVHDLAVKHPDNNFIYFHTKGMSHNYHSRSLEEITLFTKTFENWRKNLQILNQPRVNKVGLFPAKEGWIWYNFWYAKGSYLAQFKAPVLTKDRYYYESWLGRSAPDYPADTSTSYNLYQIKQINKTVFEPAEADYHKANLTYRLFATHESRKMRLFLTRPLIIQWYIRIKFFFDSMRKKAKGSSI
ncbi:hypothetical protein [Mucilaginibacter sp.]|uniref:hypothetical protein n=1 Tax=Mucilaginibacter sp. TaxID=1882438 RepID=UPI00262C57C0|nr:hypothetical protein [Mucilaginibacter sp.]MDB5126540.1 hypothetical protein [Mucilaginibacter sp.]